MGVFRKCSFFIVTKWLNQALSPFKWNIGLFWSKLSWLLTDYSQIILSWLPILKNCKSVLVSYQILETVIILKLRYRGFKFWKIFNLTSSHTKFLKQSPNSKEFAQKLQEFWTKTFGTVNYELCERSLEYMIVAFKSLSKLADIAGQASFFSL